MSKLPTNDQEELNVGQLILCAGSIILLILVTFARGSHFPVILMWVTICVGVSVFVILLYAAWHFAKAHVEDEQSDLAAEEPYLYHI
ncbi:MAG: hypothetical protein RLZZ70_504 [Candidatus Parcubacteria bacterium]